MTATTEMTAPNHPPVKFGKVGVLLVNLGTPDGTDKVSMRRYLKEFLMDRRVIEWSRFFWYPILFGIVLNTRPAKVGKAYETIWNKELNESYLRTYTRNQAEMMAKSFADLPNVRVDWAHALRPAVDQLEDRRTAEGRLREDPASSRSIRNMRPQRPRPSTTRPSRPC